MYSIDFTATAEKQLKNLEKNVQERIITTLERIRIRPYTYVKKIVNSSYYRLRVGKYRIILDIRNEKLIIFVIKVGHRRNIYK